MFAFYPTKTAQASAVLLKQEPGQRMGRLRLLKMPYIADREWIKCCRRPITGDRIVAMDHGPVLTECPFFRGNGWAVAVDGTAGGLGESIRIQAPCPHRPLSSRKE